MNLTPLTRLQLEQVCQRLVQMIPLETLVKLSEDEDSPDYLKDLCLAQQYLQLYEQSSDNESTKYKQVDLTQISPDVQEQFAQALSIPSNQTNTGERIIRVLGYLDKVESDALVYHPEPSSDELEELFHRIDLTQYELVETTMYHSE